MADRQSYPSPTAAQTRAGAGPFYGNGGVSPSQEYQDGSNSEVPQIQLSGEMENINPDLQGNGHAHHDTIADHNDHQQLAQSVMSLQEPNHYQPMSGMTHHNATLAAAQAAADAAAAAKARSKVSRACDECRRKKVRL
jgi:hypothetical protein